MLGTEIVIATSAQIEKYLALAKCYNMPLTLKEEVLQMVTALDDENALAMVKAEIEYIKSKGELDVFSELSVEDRAELMELINEPDEKDTVSHDEYLKATARWRTN